MRQCWMILALLAAACSSPTSASRDLTVETRVSTPIARPGDTVTVSVVVTNHGKRVRSVAHHECPESFVVATLGGTIVGPAEKLCAAIGYLPKELAPGEALTITAPWVGDALAGEVRWPAWLLPPGAYRIHGRVFTDGGVVEGEPVVLELVP